MGNQQTLRFVCDVLVKISPAVVVWNMNFTTFHFIYGNNHPNLLSYFSEGLKPPTTAQPVLEETSKLLLVLLHSSKLAALQFFEWKFNLPGKVDLGIPDSLMAFSKFTPRFLYETLQLWWEFLEPRIRKTTRGGGGRQVFWAALGPHFELFLVTMRPKNPSVWIYT